MTGLHALGAVAAVWADDGWLYARPIVTGVVTTATAVAFSALSYAALRWSRKTRRDREPHVQSRPTAAAAGMYVPPAPSAPLPHDSKPIQTKPPRPARSFPEADAGVDYTALAGVTPANSGGSALIWRRRLYLAEGKRGWHVIAERGTGLHVQAATGAQDTGPKIWNRYQKEASGTPATGSTSEPPLATATVGYFSGVLGDKVFSDALRAPAAGTDMWSLSCIRNSTTQSVTASGKSATL